MYHLEKRKSAIYCRLDGTPVHGQLAGQDDDREAADDIVLIAAHMVAEIHVVHLLHVQIADDDVRLVGCWIVQLLERLFSVRGVVDVVNADLTQQTAENNPHGPLIVDHELHYTAPAQQYN